MKTLKLLIFAVVVLLMSTYSCATSKHTMSPDDVKLMTTKQYNEPYELVFKSAVSLLQSEQFVISQTDLQSGFIDASKRIQKKNSAFNKYIWGFSEDATTAGINIIVNKINEEVTEVKLTVYEGTESSSLGGTVTVTKNPEGQMTLSPEIYNKWFTSLAAEIEKIKALK